MKEAWTGVLRGCWQHLGSIKSAKLNVTICLYDNRACACVRACMLCVCVCVFIRVFCPQLISEKMCNYYIFECVSFYSDYAVLLVNIETLRSIKHWPFSFFV